MESGPWRGPHSSSGYRIIQPFSIQIQSSLSNSAQSWFGTKYSTALFSSSGGIWFSDHFHDTTQIFLFWSNSAWKSGLSRIMAVHTGQSSCGKLTITPLVMYTPPSFLMTSKPNSRLNPNNFLSATRTSTSIEHPLPTSSWTRPTPQHIRAPSPTMNMSTFFFSQEWRSTRVTSDCEQPVSSKVNLWNPLVRMVTAGSASFTWGLGSRLALMPIPLACFLGNCETYDQTLYTCSNVSMVPSLLQSSAKWVGPLLRWHVMKSDKSPLSGDLVSSRVAWMAATANPASIVSSFMPARAWANSWSIDSPSMLVEAQRRLFTRSGNPRTNVHARPWSHIPPNNTESLRNSAR